MSKSALSKQEASALAERIATKLADLTMVFSYDDEIWDFKCTLEASLLSDSQTLIEPEEESRK